MSKLTPQILRVALNYPMAVRVFVVLLALFCVLALQSFSPQTLTSLDERAATSSWRMSNSQREERRVVVVDIDEKSVQALGPWPWSRPTLSSLVEGLDSYGVGLKLFDVVLPDPKGGDDLLTKALSSGAPTVLGQVFSLAPNTPVKSGQPFGGFDLGPCPSIAPPAYGYIANHPGLLARTENLSAGHITPIIDPDGAVRRVPAFVCWEGKSYPSLVVAGLLAIDGGAPQITRGGSWFDSAWRLSLSRMPDVSLPIDAQGGLRVSYGMPRDGFISVSAIDVIEQRVPKEMLHGVWTLVGSSAFGVGDAVPTPHGGAVSGLEVHAQLLSAALDGRTPYTPSALWVWPVVSCALALACLLFFANAGGRLLRGQLKPPVALSWALPVLGVALVGAIFVCHAVALLWLNLWLGWAAQSMAIVLAALLLSVVELVGLRLEKNRLFSNLSSYLSEPVAMDVAFAEASEVVDVVKSDVIVLSASLRNFGRFSDECPPDLAVSVLHQFVSMFNRVVVSHGGALHHMHGPDLLSVWSVRSPSKDANRVLAAAQELWRASEILIQGWESGADQAFFSQEGSLLELGVGIESGHALFGSIGSSKRRLHTLIGEPALVAQALQSMTADLAYPILMGPSLRANLSTQEPALTRLGEFLLPGTSSVRVLHAVVVEFNVSRLRLIIGQQNNSRAA